jgi:hypothetical protein
MARYDPEIIRAVAARDAASTRSRRLTAGALAAAAALTACFTALAANATHAKRIVHGRTTVRRPARGPVVAPAAPLVAVQTQQAPAPPPSPPGQGAPAAPPVAVSGGS